MSIGHELERSDIYQVVGDFNGTIGLNTPGFRAAVYIMSTATVLCGHDKSSAVQDDTGNDLMQLIRS